MGKFANSLWIAGIATVVWLFCAAWLKSDAATKDSPAQSPTNQPTISAPKDGTTNIPGIGPVPTDPEKAAAFKAESKKQLQEQLRAKGFFFDRQDQMQAQDNGELAWIYIEQRKNLKLAMTHILDGVVEPFHPRTVEALEHILKNSTDPKLQLDSAMLLYRYGSVNGKQYLLSVLSSPDDSSVKRHVMLGMAMNRESESISGIASALLRVPSPYVPLLSTLGKWHVPEIDAAFKVRAQQNPANWNYQFALVQGGDVAAADALMRALAKETSPSGYVKLNLEAALAECGRLDPAVWQQHLGDAFRRQPSSIAPTVLDSFSVAGPKIGSKFLQELLTSSIPLYEQFVDGMAAQAKGAREGDTVAANRFPKAPPTDFIKGAARLLSEWEVKESVPILEQILLTAQKESRPNVYLIEALGLALYRLDPDNWRNKLVSAGVPAYHVDRIPGIAKLRPIPAEFLPKQVKLKAR